MTDSEQRQSAIRERWRRQGFLVMPDGAQRPINFVSASTIVEGQLFAHARVDLLGPNEIWYVIFTGADFAVPDDMAPFHDWDNMLAVCLQDPTQKKVLNKSSTSAPGYSSLQR